MPLQQGLVCLPGLLCLARVAQGVRPHQQRLRARAVLLLEGFGMRQRCIPLAGLLHLRYQVQIGLGVVDLGGALGALQLLLGLGGRLLLRGGVP